MLQWVPTVAGGGICNSTGIVVAGCGVLAVLFDVDVVCGSGVGE